MKLREQYLVSEHKLDGLEERFIDRMARLGASLIYK
jgi:hypothetical protein